MQTSLFSAILVSVMTCKNYVNPRTLLSSTFCQERQSGNNRRRTSTWRSLVLRVSSGIQVRNFLVVSFIYHDQESSKNTILIISNLSRDRLVLPIHSNISVCLRYRFIDTAKTEKNVTCLEDLSWSPVYVGECSGNLMK